MISATRHRTGPQRPGGWSDTFPRDVRMEDHFTIKHQDRDIIKQVKSGKIRFHFANGAWHVGLELRTLGDFNMDDPATWNEEDYILIHLQDYPVGEEDPRTNKEFEITVPRG